MGARAFAATLGVLAVIGLLAYGLLTKGETSLAVGEPAPDKQLETLNGSGTGEIADYRGKWVFVNFWASWCDPCRNEAPALEDYHQRHRAEGFTVLGIDLGDATGDGRAFVERYGLTYPQLRDGDYRDRQEAYGMTGFPESFLIDPDGNLALIRRGPVTADYLESVVTPIIRGGPESS
jgi:cytochrome c biogenesis protein CcmG, thiol:disulfide interchange protein DsbE